MVTYIQVIRYIVFSLARVMVIGATIDLNVLDNLKKDHVNALAIQLHCQKVFSSYLGYKKLGD